MKHKNKPLHHIVIEECNFSTRLQYNINTNHITIGTTIQYHKSYNETNKEKIKDKMKIYYEANKEKIKDQKKFYYETNKSTDVLRVGSLEHRIKLSCIKQGINREDWNGFTTEQRYCALFSNKFKEMIRNRYHNKCYLCNTTQDRKLSVHHVNYDKNCLCQKTCEFVPLCMKCHSKTGSNRQMWEDLIMCYLYPERFFIID